MRDRRPPQKFAKNPRKMQLFLEIWPKMAKNRVIKGGGDLSRDRGPKKYRAKKGGT